jgi:mannonate dehydratase
LLGGKTRFAVDCYTHASGPTPGKVMDHVEQLSEMGFRNIRIQLGGYGSTHLSKEPDYKRYGYGKETDNILNAQTYKNGVIEIFKMARKRFGDEIEFLHDMHERLEPMDAIDMIKRPPNIHFGIVTPIGPRSGSLTGLL